MRAGGRRKDEADAERSGGERGEKSGETNMEGK